MSRRAIVSCSGRRVESALGQELLDEPALAVVGHRLADDTAGGGEGEVGDLPAQLGDGARLLRLDLGGRAVAHPVELVAGRGDVRVARLLGDLLGAGQDVVRLAAGLGQGRDALRFRALAVAARLLGVLEALLDAALPVVERPGERLERERPDDGQKKTRKLMALTRTQNRLIWIRPPSPPSSAASGRRRDRPRRDGQDVHDGSPCRSRLGRAG